MKSHLEKPPEKIDSSDKKIINTPEDIIEKYGCSNKNAMSGAEVELCFFKNDKTMQPMDSATNQRIIAQALNKYGAGAFNNEPSSDLLEANSNPAFFENLLPLFKDLREKIKFLETSAYENGHKRSFFQDLPHITGETLLQNIVDIERYQAFFAPPRADMMDIAKYFTVTKSTQVSVSYKTYDHMLENVKRLYLLAPFFFLMTDNTTGFNEAKKFTGHSGMSHRASLGDRGGFPPYIFTATNGEEYIRKHINHAMNNPLYVYYNENGELTRLPSGTWWSFNKELKQQNLNTVANYYLAQSVLWPDVKIAPIKDKDGKITHHRYEARMFGVGIHQHQTALLLVSALAFDQDFAEKVDGLLKAQGLCIKNADQCILRLQKSYEAAKNHKGKFFDILYGTGGMHDFAKEFAKLYQESKAFTLYPEQSLPLLHICESGEPDGQINRRLFPTLDQINTWQKNYDPIIFDNPNQSNALALKT